MHARIDDDAIPEWMQGRFKKLSIVGGIFKGKIEIELYPLDKVEKRVD